MTGYPKWFTPRLITSVMVFLFLTGLLLLPLSLEVRFELEMPWRLSGDGRIFTTAAHVLVSLVALLILGALLTVHLELGWKQKNKRRTGLLLIGCFAVLGLTGIGLLYAGNEALGLVSSAVHNLVGLLFIGLYVLHLCVKVTVRRSTRTTSLRT